MVKPKLAHKGNILLCVPYVLLATAIKQISVKKKMAGGGGFTKRQKPLFDILLQLHGNLSLFYI